MIVVSSRDRRYGYGRKTMFFNTIDVTPEVYAYVKKKKETYLIRGYGWSYSDREKFLSDYKHLDETKKGEGKR